MKPNFDFLSRMRSTLENLWGGVQKVVKPLSVSSQAKESINQQQFDEEAQRLAKRRDYIKQGWQLSNMTPEEMSIMPTPTPTQIPPASISPTPPPVYESQTPETNLAEEARNFLETNVFPITRRFNIPDALAASQWAVESNRSLGNNLNNVFGLGPNIQYPSLERNVEDYGLTVQNIAKAKGLDLASNPSAYDILMALQDGLKPRYEAHNPNQWDYTQTVMNTPEWRAYFR